MITLPRPTREVVPKPTREVVPRQAVARGAEADDGWPLYLARYATLVARSDPRALIGPRAVRVKSGGGRE
jgi:hypothetical protein